MVVIAATVFVAVTTEVATAAMEVAAEAMEATAAVTGYAGGGTLRSGSGGCWRSTRSGLARPLALASCYTCANANITRQCP